MLKVGGGRKYELDMCRIFACLMVVILHVAASGWYIDPVLYEWKVFNLYDMAVRSGVPLFFMISGALFLDRDNFDTKKFVTKNLFRLFFMFLIWSIIYALYEQWMGHSYESFNDFLLRVVKGHYHLWFLSTMAVIYLFVPIIHSAINNGGANLSYILIPLLVIPILKKNLLLAFSASELIQEICDKFDLSLISYLGYMVLGYFISKKNFCKKIYLIICPLVYLLVTVFSAYANRWYSLREGVAKQWLYGHFCMPVFIQACCIFIFFQYFKGMKVRHAKALKYISDCTLGVYLLHPMILDFWKRRGISVSSFNPAISVPCVFGVVACESFLITAVLKAVPLIRRTVN